MKLIFALFLSLAACGAVLAADAPAATPPPKKRITVCQPYAEKCPACADCSRCVACSKEGNRCLVKRSQLGFAPRP